MPSCMPTDYRAAFEEFARFAEQGDTGAQFNLGVMYGLGLGVAQDYLMAMDWYEKAALNGNAQAQCNLAWMYGTGRGVPQDFVRALRGTASVPPRGRIRHETAF